MSWWKTALYDTCSLITLDKILLEQAGLAGHFPSSMLALEESFTADQLRVDTSTRMRQLVTLCSLPTLAELAIVLAAASLPKSIATVDTLIFATAVHQQIAVVTGDKQLAKAIRAKGIQVGNMALILREVVLNGDMTEDECEKLLLGLAARRDFIVSGRPTPSWADLKTYTFPD